MREVRGGSKRFLAAFPQLANLITETHQAAGWRASYKFTTQYRFIIGPTLAELWGGGRGRAAPTSPFKVIFHGIGFCEHHHAELRFVARVTTKQPPDILLFSSGRWYFLE